MTVQEYVCAWLVVVNGRCEYAAHTDPRTLSDKTPLELYNAASGRTIETTAGKFRELLKRARSVEYIPPLEWTAEDDRNERRAERAGLLAV